MTLRRCLMVGLLLVLGHRRTRIVLSVLGVVETCYSMVSMRSGRLLDDLVEVLVCLMPLTLRDELVLICPWP
jgi:hypothetical protein